MGKYLHKYDNFADFEKSYNAKHNVSQIICNNGEVFRYDDDESDECINGFYSDNTDDRFININSLDLSNLAVGDSITVLQYNDVSGENDSYTYTIEDIVRTNEVVYNKPWVSYTKYDTTTKISMVIDGRTCTFNYVGVVNAEENNVS